MSKLNQVAVVASLLLAAIACGGGAENDDFDDDARTLACGGDIAGIDLVIGAGRTLLMGEIHGTNEIPAFIGEVVCHSARANHAVILGLEIPRAHQTAIDAYLTDADRGALLASSFWAQNTDGRASVAILALLDRVRAIRAQGGAIEIVAFDVDSAASAAERDEGMADLILEKRSAAVDAMLVTLSGNVHSRTIVGISFDAELTPMGFHLKLALPELVALDVVHDGGTAWVNLGDGPGVHELGASRSDAPPGTIALAPTSDGAHDGVYSVGPITAALPAAQ